ncbi:hypothetical protein [Tersicoccus sp. Bi-70]|uniref:hypothetical protein n=1 Tax=Tersicoccus sp. Bi-70 TaxID=1897634 RepID=UPI00097559EB|nr:hypothetical protein [Tersicoccus sp. Bi-70]OMH30624.1 hypothetical protein BGP79_11740 [Tersicoccus sp. Bi-70]
MSLRSIVTKEQRCEWIRDGRGAAARIDRIDGFHPNQSEPANRTTVLVNGLAITFALPAARVQELIEKATAERVETMQGRQG